MQANTQHNLRSMQTATVHPYDLCTRKCCYAYVASYPDCTAKTPSTPLRCVLANPTQAESAVELWVHRPVREPKQWVTSFHGPLPHTPQSSRLRLSSCRSATRGANSTTNLFSTEPTRPPARRPDLFHVHAACVCVCVCMCVCVCVRVYVCVCVCVTHTHIRVLCVPSQVLSVYQ